jgi:hypothetical protein
MSAQRTNCPAYILCERICVHYHGPRRGFLTGQTHYMTNRRAFTITRAFRSTLIQSQALGFAFSGERRVIESCVRQRDLAVLIIKKPNVTNEWGQNPFADERRMVTYFQAALDVCHCSALRICVSCVTDRVLAF